MSATEEQPEHAGEVVDRAESVDSAESAQGADNADAGEDGTSAAEDDPDPGVGTAGQAPRPSPRPRDTGTPQATGEDDLDTSSAGTAPLPDTGFGDGPAPVARAGRSKRRKAGYPVAVALLVCAVGFSALAVLFAQRYSDAAATTDNEALVDVATTAEVEEAVTDAAERLFSLDHNNLGQNRKAADELLINGDVRKTYEAMMRDVRQKAPEQKLVVTTTAVRSAVVRLQDDTARVLVYLDQSATRTGNKQTSAAGSAMWFRAEQRDGTWKIADMDTYSAGQSMDPESDGSGGSGPSQPAEQSRPGDAGAGQDGDSSQQQPSDQQKQEGQGSADGNGGATDGN